MTAEILTVGWWAHPAGFESAASAFEVVDEFKPVKGPLHMFKIISVLMNNSFWPDTKPSQVSSFLEQSSFHELPSPLYRPLLLGRYQDDVHSD